MASSNVALVPTIVQRALLRPLMLDEIINLIRDNFTNPLTWTLLLKPDVIGVTHRIRQHVLKGDAKDAWRIKESYKDTFAMEAVSAAIIAQIAITLPGLSDFGSIHWTATAFAYTSLVSGLLATFFSFYVQQLLSNLHSAEEVHEWLTSPRSSVFTRLWKRAPEPRQPDDRIPSLIAAATLTAPGRLLFFAIMTLFISLGIYLGSVYAAGLGTLRGTNANLAVLLFFVFSGWWAISELALPLYVKEIDQVLRSTAHEIKLRRLRGEGSEEGRKDVGATILEIPAHTSDTAVAIRQALQTSIHAQEESLKAQKAVLQLLIAQGGESLATTTTN